MDDIQKLLDEQTDQRELSEEKLGKLASFANRYNDLEDEIAELQAQLKEKNIEMNRLQLNELPDLLDQLEISGMDLSNGKKLSVKKLYGGKITPEVSDDAMQWLIGHGCEHLIKTEVSRIFKANEYGDAVDFAASLTEDGFEVKASQSVHGQTLKSWIKSMDEEGRLDEIPENLFQPGVVRRAVIK